MAEPSPGGTQSCGECVSVGAGYLWVVCSPMAGTLTVAGAASWPQNAVGGFQITSFQSGGNTHISAQTANMPVTPEEAHSGSIFLAHKAGASTLSFNVDIIWIASNGFYSDFDCQWNGTD